MSLWSVEGLKYFRHSERKWTEVYVDSVKKRKMYGEFENWLNEYGKDIKVGKSNKTLHSVLARRTTKDDDMPTKTGETECDGSEEEEDEGTNQIWVTIYSVRHGRGR